MRGLCTGIKCLTFENDIDSTTGHTITKWSDAEVKAVVEFVLFHGDSPLIINWRFGPMLPTS